MKPLVVHQNLWQLRKYALISGAFVACGIYLLKSTLEEEYPPRITGEVIIYGLSTLLFAVAAIYYFARSLQKDTALFRVDDHGFHQGKLSIPWAAIDSFAPYDYGAQDSKSQGIGLYLVPSERDKYQKPNTLKKVSGTLFNIDVDLGVNYELSGIPLEEMLATLEKFRVHYGDEKTT